MTFSTIAQEIGKILDYFGQQKCSDIHLSAPRGLWYVKDKGTLPFADMPSIDPELIDAIVKEFIHGGLEEFRKTGQGDASFDVDGEFRGRLAARDTLEGTTVTIRIISRDIPKPEDLKIPQSLIDTVSRPSGLFLFTGQTGSGKSTSIAALINHVNMTEPSAIYTLESPIEYVYPHGRSLINQREIGQHVESFSMGIENAKRSHPKIIVVGEILNRETARAAIDAAASGHCVVSTMHAGSTAETIDGFISMFTADEQPLVRTQLSQVLLAVVVQQLVPKIGGGLAMAQEIAFNSRQFSEMILGNGDRGGDMKLAQQYLLGGGRQEGMVAMESALTELVKNGEISPETARKASRNQRNINDLLATAGFPLPSKD
jgi:twitching motility protein PilT